MLKFISHIAMMISLGVIVYIAVRTLPRIDDREPKNIKREGHWLTPYMEKADVRLRIFWEKLLRKTGINLLKVENFIHKRLAKLKRETQAQDQKEFFILPEKEDKEDKMSEK